MQTLKILYEHKGMHPINNNITTLGGHKPLSLVSKLFTDKVCVPYTLQY